jgi:RNA polymerase sigma-70 factor (ECF subfamily)
MCGALQSGIELLVKSSPWQEEAAFVARLRAGEESAYRDLIARHHGTLLTLAGSVLRNRASAEEVVQETWLAVVAHIGRFEGRARLATWIIEILLNKARSRAVRDRRWVSFADLATMAPTSAEDGVTENAAPGADFERFLADGHWAEPVRSWEQLDPERIVAGRELWSHVAQAMSALPDAQRAVVVMRDVDGLELDQIEHLLGLSRANVRVLLHRGRVRLRAVIQALQDGANLARPHASVKSPSGADCNSEASRTSEEAEPGRAAAADQMLNLVPGGLQP